MCVPQAMQRIHTGVDNPGVKARVVTSLAGTGRPLLLGLEKLAGEGKDTHSSFLACSPSKSKLKEKPWGQGLSCTFS